VNDFEAPHPNGAVVVNEAPTPEQLRRRKIRRRVFGAIAVVVVAVWAYAIWFSVTKGSPEDLDDRARSAVRTACDEARTQLEALPDFTPASTAPEDVDLVRQENAVFDQMIATIDAVEPTDKDAAEALDKWLDDWRALIVARADFADDLADDGTARLRIPAVSTGGLEPITERMNGYANQRGLEPCRPDALQAEIVDGGRDYSTVED
jgi:hypothetical protein